MVAWLTALLGVLATASALAQEMNGEQARRFVADKLFAFTCVDGSRGSGRIYADGSVIGNIQSNGSGPVRPVGLPRGTVRIKGEAVCASLKGLAFEPCFALIRTSNRSFRGSVNGMGMLA